MDNRMTTKQKILIGNSNDLSVIKNNSIDLILTSPPYPMISMWDETFNYLNDKIDNNLINNCPYNAFELMHKELEYIYLESFKKLKDDGIFVINIGDATRNCNGSFSLFPNGSRTISFFIKNNFNLLPSIIWNKPTNSPNKFMGSGMLPVGAYNTLEYEHILIFRKNKRNFKSKDLKNKRNKSAFFWNERNIWCSNIWNFVGEKQNNKNDARERNGAFPIELPYRIISMWTTQEDYVLDIFGGTGTTLLASTALGRNGIIVELKKQFKKDIEKRLLSSKEKLNMRNLIRIENQKKSIIDREKKNKKINYFNKNYNVPVITKQETELKIPLIENIKIESANHNETVISVEYKD